MSDKKVVLHRGKEKAIRNHHHWIFSGAIKHLPEFENGDILPVFSSEKEFLGWGYFHSKCSITGRMISFEQKDPLVTLKEKIQKAIEFRKLLFENSETNACRIINSEGDGIPGLIVDKYNEIVVIQVSTLGIEKLKPFIVETLAELLSPTSIFEHSASPSRREEGLKTVKQLLAGNPFPQQVEIRENGLTFLADIERGQKTGFFLDQREMRRLVGELAVNRRVLNCFSYTGAFSVYALKGGARQVDSVDISAEAIEATRRHFEVNHCELEGNRLIVEDVFSFLRQPELPYDLCILDPPAFAKKKTDIIQACRGYKEINRLAMAKLPAQSLLLTCSCSYHVDEKLFQQVIFQAACEATRSVRIIQKHHLAPDHPVNLFHPEGSYLKSFLLYLD